MSAIFACAVVVLAGVWGIVALSRPAPPRPPGGLDVDDLIRRERRGRRRRPG